LATRRRGADGELLNNYMEFTLIEIIVVSVAAFWLGSKVTQLTQTWAFRKVLEELGVTDQQLRALAEREGIRVPAPEEAKPDLAIVEIRIEKMGEMLFAYRLDNDQFLGQGADKDKLIESLKHNLTNVRVIIAKEDGADYIADGRQG